MGKTSVSAALAVALSSMPHSLKVLVVSTDPAHSLGDALDENLRRPSTSTSTSATTAHAVPMTDPLTGGNLWACEVDASAALASFQEQLAAFDVDRLAASLGVSSDALDGLGLREFGGLLRNPPPGLDELVALLNVLEDNDQGKSQSATTSYDVILVDTAPTGHTLRLLALPQFLDGLLGKLVKLRLKLSGLASTLQAFLGAGQAQQRAQAIDDAANRLNQFQSKMQRLRSRLRDPIRTRFVVVTIPTRLAVAESKRLLSELQSQQVRVTDVVINQCVGTLTEGDIGVNVAAPALKAYYDRRKAGQTKWIENLRSAVADVSASPAYQSNGRYSQPIALTEVPFFDVELVGIPALGYIGSQCFANNPSLDHLMRMDDGGGPSPGPRVVVCGGKGGVGKTTTSASLAVTMAACGHTVAIISTDPAHSLGDALDVSLAGGQLVPCPLVGVPGNTGEGSVSALEIDPSSAIKQFKGIVDQLVNGGGSGVQEDAGGGMDGSGGLRNALKDLEEVFDTLPAGTDEVVALAKIVNLVRRGNFDRIVLDTAPTGHTLRMLSTPGFLAELIDRLLAIADKINTNPAIRLFLSAATSARRDDLDDAAATAKSQLLSFQLQMYELEDLFSDGEQTEFLIVTIATELAARESIRLLNDLTFEAPDMPIKVRNVVVNQVLSDDDSNVQNFVSHLAKSQAASVDDLQRSIRALTHPPRITQVPYLDTEPRGVYGLKILADELQKDDAIVGAPVP